MKTGANFEDQNAIKRWAESGASAEVISQELLIEQSVVERFMPLDEAEAEEESDAED